MNILFIYSSFYTLYTIVYKHYDPTLSLYNIHSGYRLWFRFGCMHRQEEI